MRLALLMKEHRLSSPSEIDVLVQESLTRPIDEDPVPQRIGRKDRHADVTRIHSDRFGSGRAKYSSSMMRCALPS
jgi:hypothetical protein